MRRHQENLTGRQVALLFGAAIMVGVIGGVGFVGLFINVGTPAGSGYVASGTDPDSVDLGSFSTAAGGIDAAKQEPTNAQMLCADFGICLPGISK